MTTAPQWTLSEDRRAVALDTRGFMPEDEGDALFDAGIAAGRACPGLPWVEVGSYCGRSTVWLGAAAEVCDAVLFTIDHHRGSEETQPGWHWHDPTVVDPVTGLMETLPFLRTTLWRAELEDTVIPIVGQSPVVARHWSNPLGLVFIDGGHGIEPARADYEGWTPLIAPGGHLVIHDVFPDPADGGRPPYEAIFKPALDSGRFALVSATGSLRVLRRVD